MPAGTALRRTEAQRSPLADALDWQLIESVALERGDASPVRNVDRDGRRLLSHQVAKQHGRAGLPDGTIRFTLHGSAGQSFGAWLAPGIELTLVGEANDYAGKGLSGRRRSPCGRPTGPASSPRRT